MADTRRLEEVQVVVDTIQSTPELVEVVPLNLEDMKDWMAQTKPTLSANKNNIN